MKKILALLILIFTLSGCNSDQKISDQSEFDISKYTLNVDSVTIKDDDLTVSVNWSFKADKDSTEKEKFSSTGILFSATQNGNYLKDNLEDSGIDKEVNEKNKGSITPKFILDNKEDPVKLTIFNAASDESKEIEIKLK